MRHFVTCLAFVAGLIVGNVADAGSVINMSEFKHCISDVSTTTEDFDLENNPSAFTLDFSHPNVEKYSCEEVYHRYVEKGKGGDALSYAIVDKLRAARSAGLIDDLRESKTTGCGRYCFEPPKEYIMKEEDLPPCVRSDGAIFQRPRGSTEACPAGFREAD